MRGHHQEDHVVDDVLVGEAVAVLVLGVAQDSEQVTAVLASTLLDALTEVVLQQLDAPGDRATR